MTNNSGYEQDVIAWANEQAKAIDETGLSDFPEQCPWAIADILDRDWKPE